MPDIGIGLSACDVYNIVRPRENNNCFLKVTRVLSNKVRHFRGIPPMEVVAEISAHFSSFILVSPSEVHLFLRIQISRRGPAHWGGLVQFEHSTKRQNIQFFF